MVGQSPSLGLEASIPGEKSQGSVDPGLGILSVGPEAAFRTRKIIVPPKVIDPNQITVIKLGGNPAMAVSTETAGTNHREQNNLKPRDDSLMNDDYVKEWVNSTVHTRIIVPPNAVNPDEVTVIKLGRKPELSTQVAKPGYNGQMNHPSQQQQHKQQLVGNLRSGIVDELKERVKSIRPRIKTLLAVPTTDHPDIAIVSSMTEDDRPLQEILGLEDVSSDSRAIPRQRGGFVPDTMRTQSLAGAPDPCDKCVSPKTDEAALETGMGDRPINFPGVSPMSSHSKPKAETACCPNESSNNTVEANFRLTPHSNSPLLEHGHSRFVNPLEDLQKSLSSSPDPEDVDFLLQFKLLST